MKNLGLRFEEHGEEEIHISKQNVHIKILVCKDQCLPRLSYEICNTRNKLIINFNN